MHAVTPPGVSRIGLGLAALGRPGYINVDHARDLAGNYEPAAMEQRTHAVLDAAYDGGIRYFDAARSYGRAEDFLASWLATRRIAPGAVVVASKWGYTYTAGWRVDAERHEVKDHSLGTLRRQLAETRAWLGAHLSLYQIHSALLERGAGPALAEAHGAGMRVIVKEALANGRLTARNAERSEARNAVLREEV